MCQDVGKTLVDVGRQTRIVLDHVERSGRHSALRDALRHQKEVEAFVQRHRVVDDEAGRRGGGGAGGAGVGPPRRRARQKSAS